MLLLAGCAGTVSEKSLPGASSLPQEVLSQMANQPVPGWVATHVDARHPDKFFLTGVGESSSSFPEAEAQARADLAKRIEVQIEGKDSFVALETSHTGYEYAVKSDVTEGVTITLSGLTIADRWVDATGRRYYALAVLNREKAVAALRTDLDDWSEQMRALLAKAAEWEAQQEPFQAVASLGRLQGLAGDAQALRKRYLVLRGDLPDPRPLATMPSPMEMEQRLDDLLASLRLLPVSGDGQRAIIGKPLGQPLIVQLVRRRGNEEMPVRDLPILFAFERGQGQVEQTKRTDQSGQARVTVRDVRPTTDMTAAIAAKPDVETLIKGLLPTVGRRVADHLGRQVVVFNVIPPRGLQAGADLWTSALGKLSEDLLSRFDFDDQGKPTMAVLDFVETYGSQRLPLSQRLESGLRTALSQWEFVSIVDKKAPAAAKPEEKARALGVGHYVDGLYALSADTLTVNASLRKLSDGTTKAAAVVTIPRGALTSQDVQGFQEQAATSPGALLSGPSLSPQAASPAYEQLLARLVMLHQPTPPFRVKLWTGKQTYTVGEKITFFFEAERDCYVTLIDIGTSGRLTVLFPNQWEQNNFVAKGRRVAIPEPQYGFDINVSGPTGTERVKAIVTTQPFTLFEKMTFDNGFFGLGRDEGEEGGTRDFQLSPKPIAPNQWTDAAIEVLILDKGKTEPRGRGLMRGAKEPTSR